MTCDFCYRRCDIAEGGYGICRSRAVKDGKLLSPHYSELCSSALDPVEKKPIEEVIKEGYLYDEFLLNMDSNFFLASMNKGDSSFITDYFPASKAASILAAVCSISSAGSCNLGRRKSMSPSPCSGMRCT